MEKAGGGPLAFRCWESRYLLLCEKCLVFDAITAWRVFSLERYARDAPRTPAKEALAAAEMAVIGQVTDSERLRPSREERRRGPGRPACGPG